MHSGPAGSRWGTLLGTAIHTPAAGSLEMLFAMVCGDTVTWKPGFEGNRSISAAVGDERHLTGVCPRGSIAKDVILNLLVGAAVTGRR